MIVSRLMGGLGNQMFQYAAGFALARHHHVTLKMDNLFLMDKSKRSYRFEYRPYALDIFTILGELATSKEISQFVVPRVGNKYFYHLKYCIVPQKNVINESSINNYEELIQLPDHVYLDGYFQKYAYFGNIIKELKNEFTFKDALPAESQMIVHKIKSSNAVCVVFRRGDYVGHPTLDIITLDYYYYALKILKEKVSDFSIFVFSDDIPWCRQNFKPNHFPDVHFVNQNLTGEKGKYYLQLMTLCKHFIIPNSTYPYWGALLCANADKVVIAPQKWYKGQQVETNAILPSEWIAL
jgi:hypothetical protein